MTYLLNSDWLLFNASTVFCDFSKMLQSLLQLDCVFTNTDQTFAHSNSFHAPPTPSKIYDSFFCNYYSKTHIIYTLYVCVCVSAKFIYVAHIYVCLRVTIWMELDSLSEGSSLKQTDSPSFVVINCLYSTSFEGGTLLACQLISPCKPCLGDHTDKSSRMPVSIITEDRILQKTSLSSNS